MATADCAINLIKPDGAIPIHCGDSVGTPADAEDFRGLAAVHVEIIPPRRS